jgi:hypothetical protein
MRTFASWVVALNPTIFLALFLVAEVVAGYYFRTDLLNGLSLTWNFLSFVLGSVWNFFVALWSDLVGVFV